MFPSRVRPFVVAVALLACTGIGTASARQFVRKVPLSSWLNAQGIQLVFWQEQTGPQVSPPVLGNLAGVDYAGGRAQAFGLSFGFNASGSITVRELPDGTGKVIVDVSYSNAITWAFDAGFTPIYAYAPALLAGDPSLSPGLSNGHIQAQYTVPDAEIPELNLFAVVFNGAGTIERLQLHCSGQGPLRAGFGVAEGTPGRCTVVQTAIFTNGGGATADAFPVEHVDVAVAGHSLQSTRAASSLTTGGPTASRTWGQLKACYRVAEGDEQK